MPLEWLALKPDLACIVPVLFLLPFTLTPVKHNGNSSQVGRGIINGKIRLVLANCQTKVLGDLSKARQVLGG